MTLRWVQQSLGAQYAYSGALIVGMVVVRGDGTVGWTLDRVHTKHIVKGYGDAKSVASAKRALARAWRIWCEKAGLSAPSRPIGWLDNIPPFDPVYGPRVEWRNEDRVRKLPDRTPIYAKESTHGR